MGIGELKNAFIRDTDTKDVSSEIFNICSPESTGWECTFHAQRHCLGLMLEYESKVWTKSLNLPRKILERAFTGKKKSSREESHRVPSWLTPPAGTMTWICG